MNTTKPYSILDELMVSPPTHNIEHQCSTNTATSTASSISHPLSAMTTTTTLLTHSCNKLLTPLLQHASILDKCHDNIIFGKVNIRVPLPPVYIREVWNYSQAKAENIEYATSNFNWKSKLCTDIQRNAELSIIKIVEEHLTFRYVCVLPHHDV